jgi:hypothetical protein
VAHDRAGRAADAKTVGDIVDFLEGRVNAGAEITGFQVFGVAQTKEAFRQGMGRGEFDLGVAVELMDFRFGFVGGFIHSFHYRGYARRNTL